MGKERGNFLLCTLHSLTSLWVSTQGVRPYARYWVRRPEQRLCSYWHLPGRHIFSHNACRVEKEERKREGGSQEGWRRKGKEEKPVNSKKQTSGIQKTTFKILILHSKSEVHKTCSGMKGDRTHLNAHVCEWLSERTDGGSSPSTRPLAPPASTCSFPALTLAEE